MIGIFNVDGRNVVGKQQNLVAPNLALVLHRQLAHGHQLLVLQQVHDERARAREGVEYVHALVRQALPELLLQQTVRGMQNIIHHLVGRVHDAHLLRGGFERYLEELLVKVADQLLPCGIGCHHGSAPPHARVHVLEHLGIGSLA